MCTRGRCTHKLYLYVLFSQHMVIQFRGRNVNIVKNGRNRLLHSSVLKILNFFHSCEKFYLFSHVPLAPPVKRRNLSHSWKKSQIFNRDSCKNLLVSVLKNKRQRKPKGQSKTNNPEKLATQEDEKQNKSTTQYYSNQTQKNVIKT